MDEFTADTFANRDESIPVIVLDHDLSDGAESDGQPDRKRDQFKKRTTNMKENIKRKSAETGSSIQDRLLERLLHQVIPIEDLPSNKESLSGQGYTERPSFSLPTMSANFRRFNSRIGVVFVFQAKIIRLLSWKQWSHTLSFLALYTFVCLDPYLVTVLPFALLLLALLIPSFITRHPAPPTTLTSPSDPYSTAGPPLAAAPTVKPVKELSKDFFRNMRDLQNSMEDFSRLHDKIIAVLTPPTNFSDEPLSSTVFLFCFATAGFMFIASHLMPWRVIFLVIGWTVTCIGHPTIQRQMMNTHTQLVAPHEEQAKSWLDGWIARDIILDSAPETREVEIFELQRLSLAGEWESWVFSPSPYDPLSSARIRGSRPTGTRFFEDVQPPPGWSWSEKKWALDLWSREWVEERIITGVEVETEGERWVYDLNYESGDEIGGPGGTGGSDRANGSSLSPDVETPTRKRKGIQMRNMPSWEEGGEGGDEGFDGRRGEWRRRRWVRMVKRRGHVPSAGA